MLQRAIQAAKADPNLFETVEHDDGYTGEAGIIVAVVSVLGAIGTLLAGGGFGGFIAALISGILGWFVWAGLTNFIGTRFFGGTADFGEMLRVTGYAQAPLALTIIPIVGLLAFFWFLYVAVVALRQGLDISTGKAVAVGIIGVILLGILRAIFSF